MCRAQMPLSGEKVVRKLRLGTPALDQENDGIVLPTTWRYPSLVLAVAVLI